MDVRPRPEATDSEVMRFSPTRAELVRFFAWGYLSRRELKQCLRRVQPRNWTPRPPRVPTAA